MVYWVEGGLSQYFHKISIAILGQNLSINFSPGDHPDAASNGLTDGVGPLTPTRIA